MKDWLIFPCKDNESLAIAISNRAIELGYKTCHISTKDMAYTGAVALGRRAGNSITNAGGYVPDLLRGDNVQCQELGNLNDLFYTEKYSIEKKIQVKINNQYTAEITKNNVVVGCQTFPISVIDDLYNAKKEVMK